MTSNVFSISCFVLSFIASIIIVPVGKIVRVESSDRWRIDEAYVESEKIARIMPNPSGGAIRIEGISAGITRIDFKSVKNVENHVWIVVPRP